MGTKEIEAVNVLKDFFKKKIELALKETDTVTIQESSNKLYELCQLETNYLKEEI